MIANPRLARESRPRILLVEDHVGAAISIGRLLTHFGYDVRVERDGLAAIRTAREFVPDVALIDLSLSILDGFAVARHLRESPRTHSALLIAMTGWSDPEEEQRARACGFDRQLMKPISANALAEVLSDVPGQPPRYEVASPSEMSRG